MDPTEKVDEKTLLMARTSLGWQSTYHADRRRVGNGRIEFNQIQGHFIVWAIHVPAQDVLQRLCAFAKVDAIWGIAGLELVAIAGAEQNLGLSHGVGDYWCWSVGESVYSSSHAGGAMLDGGFVQQGVEFAWKGACARVCHLYGHSHDYHQVRTASFEKLMAHLSMDQISLTEGRNEIASCSESAYTSLPLSDAATLLHFKTQDEVVAFAKEVRPWDLDWLG